MAADTETQDWLPLDTGMLTAAGVAALIGALFLGIAALIGSRALLEAVREWTNQQEVPPTESAKSFIRSLHNAALAGTTAGADAWKKELSSSSAD
jgi:predicted membrane-bound mannosyltransferase